jgi:hypothetical protein
MVGLTGKDKIRTLKYNQNQNKKRKGLFKVHVKVFLLYFSSQCWFEVKHLLIRSPIHARNHPLPTPQSWPLFQSSIFIISCPPQWCTSFVHKPGSWSDSMIQGRGNESIHESISWPDSTIFVFQFLFLTISFDQVTWIKDWPINLLVKKIDSVQRSLVNPHKFQNVCTSRIIFYFLLLKFYSPVQVMY